jgi:hypothetical protein
MAKAKVVTKRKRPAKVKETAVAVVDKERPRERDHSEPHVSAEKMTREKVIRAFDVLGITSKLDGQNKKELFVDLAIAYNLNPMKRELHAMEIAGALVPEVGYEVYIKRAEQSQRLEYWNTEVTGEIDLANWQKSTYCVTLVVKRKDRPKEQRFDSWFSECVGLRDGKPNSMWIKRPRFMTWKCAVAMMRIAFPEVLSEMPYIDAEYSEDMMTEGEKIPSIAEPQPTAGSKVSENGKKIDEPSVEKKPDTLEAVRAEVQATYSDMARVVNTTKDENGTEVKVRLFSLEELKKHETNILAHKADIEWFHEWLKAQKVELSNRKLDYSLADKK